MRKPLNVLPETAFILDSFCHYLHAHKLASNISHEHAHNLMLPNLESSQEAKLAVWSIKEHCTSGWLSGDNLSRDTGSTVVPLMVAHLWAFMNSQPRWTSTGYSQSICFLEVIIGDRTEPFWAVQHDSKSGDMYWK